MPRLLLAMILAGTLTGIALANESNDDHEAPPANVTLTCSVGTSGSAVCFAERPIATFGAVELALGIDTRVILAGPGKGHVTGYLIIGVYERAWHAWLELAMPEIVPPIGKNDFLRAGFSFRF